MGTKTSFAYSSQAKVKAREDFTMFKSKELIGHRFRKGMWSSPPRRWQWKRLSGVGGGKILLNVE